MTARYGQIFVYVIWAVCLLFFIDGYHLRRAERFGERNFRY
jgi:hypothetical protein